MPLSLLAWSLTIAALIHIFAEFVFPGGFKTWWCAYRRQIAASATNRFLVIINVLLVLFSANVAVAAQARRGNGVAAWLALAALLAGNAVFQRRRCHSDEAVFARHDLWHFPLHSARNLWLRLLCSEQASIITHISHCRGARRFLLFYLNGQSPPQSRRNPDKGVN